MTARDGVLEGRFVRLEPLEPRHAAGLAAASGGEGTLYRWSPVPAGVPEAAAYVETALAWRDAGTAVPYATVRLADRQVVGSTRFFDLERWPWPAGHPRSGRTDPDVGEIGYTWLAGSAIRTGANTEAKLLMLGRAFDDWGMLRVCFHTDARNERSRAALERIGARFEGVLRAHRPAVDGGGRDSARFSVVAADWPAVQERLTEFLARGPKPPTRSGAAYQ